MFLAEYAVECNLTGWPVSFGLPSTITHLVSPDFAEGLTQMQSTNLRGSAGGHSHFAGGQGGEFGEFAIQPRRAV
jgi:hypothetical protein